MRVYALASLVLLSTVPRARAQNLPPAAVAVVGPAEIVAGAEASFDASGSFDPDEGPEALSFSWDFDDGASAVGATATHTFPLPGAYRVRVTADDGAARSEAGVTVFVLSPVSPADRTSSSPLAVSDDTAWVADAVGGAVVAVSLDSGEALWTTPLGDATSVARSSDGAALFVLSGQEVCELDPGSGELRRRAMLPATGSAMLLARGADRLVVAASDGRVIVLDRGLEVLAIFDTGVDAVALASDGRSSWLASFLSREPATAGALTEVLHDELRVGRRVELAFDESPDSASSGGGVPNLLGALAFDPSGRTLWVGGTKSSTRGLARDGRELTPENRVRGLLAPVDSATGADLATARIDTNDAGLVSAIAFSVRGRYLFAAHPGIGAVSIYDMPQLALFRGGDPGATVPFTARVPVGSTPDALALTPDGRRLVVRLREAIELVVVDVAEPAGPTVTLRARIAPDERPPAVALGARAFHDSSEPLYSRGGYVACAHCHPGGGMDGRTWDFTQFGEGLRNTIDLRGRGGLADGPLHWSANFDEVQDFENDIVVGFGGDGLAGDGQPPHASLGAVANAGRSELLDALAAYVSSLDRAPTSPHGERTASAEDIERGRALFFDRRVGCATCHTPPRYTDSSLEEPFRLHDVGTLRPTSGGRLGGELVGLDTPSLVGVWASAPYLHDGRSPDLRAVLTTDNARDAHGVTSHLDDSEVDALVAYLLTLDEHEEGPVATGGCASAGATPTGGASFALTTAALLWSRRRRRLRRQCCPPDDESSSAWTPHTSWLTSLNAGRHRGRNSVP